MPASEFRPAPKKLPRKGAGTGDRPLAQQTSADAIVLLMRHGETPWNREGRVMGRREVGLDEQGRAQVRAACCLLKGVRPRLIFTSPLRRAHESAELVAASLGGMAVVADSRLVEVAYGYWEGMTYDQLLHDEQYLDYRRRPLDFAPPGGETIYDVQARGLAAVNAAVGRAEGGSVLVVSHGDIIRTVLCHFAGMALGEFRRLRVDNASLSAVGVREGTAEVKFLNLLADAGRALAGNPFAGGA